MDTVYELANGCESLGHLPDGELIKPPQRDRGDNGEKRHHPNDQKSHVDLHGEHQGTDQSGSGEFSSVPNNPETPTNPARIRSETACVMAAFWRMP